MAHRPRFYLPIAALLFNLGTPVFAMRIGDLEVIGNMGDPLHARIAIVTDDEASLRDDCFRLVGPDSRRGPLAEARLELVASGGKRYVDIRTRTPVSDPILDLTLRTEGCGPTIQKDFVILLSPKNIVLEAVAPPLLATLPASAPAAAANPTASVRPRSAALRPKIPFQQRHPAPRSWQRAAPVEHRRQQMPNQPGHLSLRLDYGFNSLARFTEQVAKRRQQLQNKIDAKPGPATPAKPLSGAEPRSQSAQVGQGDKLVLQPTTQGSIPALPANPSTQPGGQANGVTAQSQATAGNNQAKAAIPGIAYRLPAPEANRLTGAWGRWLSSSYPLILLTLVLVALVALWLKRRTPASRFLDKTAPGIDTLLPVDPENPQRHPLLSHNLPPVDHAFAEPPAAKTLLSETFKPTTKGAKTAMIDSLADDLELPAMAMPMSDFTVEQFDSTDQVLELAEVMLAFGRSSQAIDTLSQYIRKNPDQAITPWLKLLDLYFQSKLRNEFDALAMDLHRHFNVTVAEWPDYERTNGLPMEDSSLTLESLPHIMDRLTSTWDTPAALTYLDKLLSDNRGGQRQGFSLPLVRDILLLRDILRQTSAVPTPIH